MRPRTVVIAHRNTMVAEGIAAALERYPWLVSISTTTSAAHARTAGEQADAVAIDRDLAEARATALHLRRKGVRVVFIGEDESALTDEDVCVPLQHPTSALAAALVPGATDAPPTTIASLTKRQRQILELISQGLAAKQVARALGISPKTVERHKTMMYAKLGVPNQAAAVKVGLRAVNG